MSRLLLTTAAIAVMVAAAGIVPASAGVRMSDDEVVFTLRAPNATVVYLVGDFNNWNATVEPMPRSGDRFEISLFLVEGTYRYKFVVDGRWIVDPENVGSDPQEGSPLVLFERGGVLMLSAEDLSSKSGQSLPDFGVRYIGKFDWEDSDSESTQRVDASVRARRDHLTAGAVVSTEDHSWRTSQPFLDVYFNGGFVEVEAAGLRLRGFENDSTWVSSDPTVLLGDEGLYGYDAGFARHGVSANMERSAFALRVLYDDHKGRGTDESVVSASDLSEFRAGSGSDTTAYAYTDTWNDADQFAADLYLDFKSLKVGYARRNDRGLNPGVLAEVARIDSTFETTVHSTRESRALSVWWLRFTKLLGFSLDLAYGTGSSDVVANSQGELTGDLTDDISAAVATTRSTSAFEFMTTDRTLVALDRTGTTWDVRLGWESYGFDFPASATTPASSAEVHRVELTGALDRGAWKLYGAVTHTDQDYGATPDALHIDWPERNIWLNLWDNLSVTNIVGFGFDAYTDVGIDVSWTSDNVEATGATSAGAAVDITTQDFVGRTLRSALHAWVEQVVGSYFVFVFDGNVARYDIPQWGAGATTFAYGYVEAGYRRGPLYVNLGVGFDPTVFDPVITDYNNIGRSEEIRGALATGVRRSNAATIGAGVLEAERGLEDATTIKLECVIRF